MFQASPIAIGGFQAVVEEKRSTSRGKLDALMKLSIRQEAGHIIYA